MATPGAWRERAKRWLLLHDASDLVLAKIICLADEYRRIDRDAEERGFDRGMRLVLDAVARHNVDLANVVAAELAQGDAVPPLDGDTQPGEHVAEKLRPTATAGR